MKMLTTIRRFTLARFLVAGLRKLAPACILLGLALPLAAQSTSGGLIVADFNHDGVPDTLIPSDASQSFTLSFGTVPYGTFNPVAKLVPYPTGCTAIVPNAVVVGDFNGDGIPDIAMTCTGSPAPADIYTIYVLLGAGDGTFFTAASYPGLSNLVVGDFNHDSVLDLAAVGGNGVTAAQSITVLIGKGDGTFPSSNTISILSTPYTSAIAVDLNQDGYTDIAIGNFSGTGAHTVDVYGNNKNGTFGTLSTSYTPTVSLAVGSGDAVTDQAILTGNFFNSGLPDLAVVDTGSSPGIYLIKNVAKVPNIEFATPTKTQAITGLQSAVTASIASPYSDFLISNGAALTVLANDGSGNFSSTSFAGLTLFSMSPFYGAVDVNADGHADIFTAINTATTSAITVNLISGTASASSTPFPLPAAGTVPVSAAWPGNINFTGATATGQQIVNGIPTTVSLTSSKNPSLAGDPVTFTAGVLPTSFDSLVPTGTLTFTDGATPLGTVPLGTSFSGSVTVSTLAVGPHNIQVVYSGDNVFASSTLGLTQQVNPQLALTSFTPSTAQIGAPATAITITGVGFTSTTVAQINDTTLPTTFVNSTTLTAVIPSTYFSVAATLQINLANGPTNSVTPTLPFVVSTPVPVVTLTAPTTTPPASQPSVNFALTNTYPVDLVATFTLTDKSGVATGAVDPAVQFATGGTTYTVTIPAGSQTTPPIQVQAGTLAATITVPVNLTANGINVTPTGLAATIVVPAAVPSITATKLVRSGKQITVTITGFSNTLDIVKADFHFNPISGVTLSTPDISAPVGPVFATYFALPSTLTYGGTFVYTQVFNVSDTASNIASVQVTLTNSVGVSSTQTAQ